MIHIGKKRHIDQYIDSNVELWLKMKPIDTRTLYHELRIFNSLWKKHDKWSYDYLHQNGLSNLEAVEQLLLINRGVYLKLLTLLNMELEPKILTSLLKKVLNRSQERSQEGSTRSPTLVSQFLTNFPSLKLEK